MLSLVHSEPPSGSRGNHRQKLQEVDCLALPLVGLLHKSEYVFTYWDAEKSASSRNVSLG
jgi:hypothetical protein